MARRILDAVVIVVTIILLASIIFGWDVISSGVGEPF